MIQKSNLTEHPLFDPRQSKPTVIGQARQWLGGLLSSNGEEAAPWDQEELANAVRDTFQSQLLIEPVRLSQLVKVSFNSPDRKLAAAIANEVATAYIDADMDARYAITQQAHGWLNDRLATLRTNLIASEKALQSYRERKGLIDRQTGSQGGVGKQLEELSLRLVEARVRRSQAEQAYKQVRGNNGKSMASVPAVLANPLVSRAREIRIDGQRRLADISQRLGTAHPQYLAARAELRSAEAAEDQAIESVTQSISREYESARAVETQLEQALAKSRGEVQTENRDEFELASYEREVDTNRKLYDTFYARFKETDGAFDFQSAVARVVDPAVSPAVPVKPAKMPIVLGALMCGLILGVAAALLMHRTDNGLHSVEDAEERLGVPVLAALPILRRNEVSISHKMLLRAPDHGFSEGIRTARSAMLLSTAGAEQTVVVITSSLPGEGKSTISMNLALAQAQTSRTLMIESDMRRPTLGRRLGLPPTQKGLAELLAGTASLSDCLVKMPEQGLHLIVAGAQTINPLEMLSSQAFRDLVGRLRNEYEMVIIDTPPVAMVSDATIVAALASTVVFVVKANATPHQLVRQSLRKLGAASAPILGTIVNQLDFDQARKYYGGYEGYSAEGYGGYAKSAAAD